MTTVVRVVDRVVEEGEIRETFLGKMLPASGSVGETKLMFAGKLAQGEDVRAALPFAHGFEAHHAPHREMRRNENDFGALKQTLVAWCECGFNLVTTAQRLAIHRNTVIYRLDKISRLTARDVREPEVAIALCLARLITD